MCTLVAAAALALAVSAPSARTSGTYTVVFQNPSEAVIDAVREVSKDGVIRGTSQYAGEKYISGAVPALSTKVFPKTAEGTVFYKVREQTVAPSNFVASNDVGTLAVRYLVQPVDAQRTRVIIDAAFVEDSHHGSHPSEGAVELSEYAAIVAKLKALEEQRKLTRAQEQRNDLLHQRDELQRNLQEESAQADVLEVQIARAREERDQLRKQLVGEVIRGEAQLRAAPYTHATALQSLKQGDKVDILDRTAYWYRVRTAQGKEGWLYRLALEGVQ